MKRYRIANFYIDSTRSVFRGLPKNAAMAMAKKDMESSLKSRYGELGFDQKFERYMALDKPVLSVVEEHSFLLEDICNAYVGGSFYSALTGACCLGERIFNNIIFKVADDFKSSPRYKEVYGKGSIIDWDLAINILSDWKIIDDVTQTKYLRLKRLRHESVHYQKKEQDAAAMSLEAINLVNSIIHHLFGIDQHRKDILLYFDVPGEIYIRKAAEALPIVKTFYIPCAVLVGPRFEMAHDTASGKFKIIDNYPYDAKEITDEEFVRLRNEHTGKTGKTSDTPTKMI
ncbi:MAG: hypothetical protein UV55_C0023G0009 [Candidatus Gottesmanbacteria bacterium GW2011_GWC1_43_10]|nr:MAG: hypothetical protein UV55_C0023G0009 [Candidatus Gottesmanbacteria bacterium GW2011_GWC1_43_10]